MSERDALLRAVCENPGDDTVRLAFADWCDENGEPDRAAFVRLDVSGAPTPRPTVGQMRKWGWWTPPHPPTAYYRAKSREWVVHSRRARWAGSECFKVVVHRGFPSFVVCSPQSLSDAVAGGWSPAPVEAQLYSGTPALSSDGYAFWSYPPDYHLPFRCDPRNPHLLPRALFDLLDGYDAAPAGMRGYRGPGAVRRAIRAANAAAARLLAA